VAGSPSNESKAAVVPPAFDEESIMEAQEIDLPPCPQQAQPGAEHHWLEKLVGTWSCSSCMAASADAAPEELTGTETVRRLGGYWIVSEATSDMPGGGKGQMVTTIGYDVEKKTYVGTWVGSMVNWLCHYHEGEVDASGTRLSLYATGPNMSGGGGTCNYRDVIEFISDDERTLTGQVQDEHGNWQEMMKIHYRRR